VSFSVELLLIHQPKSESPRSKVIDALLDDLASSQPLAYFYCQRRSAEPKQSDPTEILRCIVKQLSLRASGGPIMDPV
jgi:hypothetical protein